MNMIQLVKRSSEGDTHTCHDVDDAIVYLLTRRPGYFRKVVCPETRKTIVSSLECTADFYNTCACNYNIKRIADRKNLNDSNKELYNRINPPCFLIDKILDVHRGRDIIISEKPSSDLLETIDKLFSMFSDDQSEEMYIHYTKDFSGYLLNNFINIITTFFREYDLTDSYFANRGVDVIEHDGKKYYFSGSVENDYYFLYGFVYNEDKKMIAGVKSREENDCKYDFIEIYPHVVPMEVKHKIESIADDILP
jgi:hypothetical protein